MKIANVHVSIKLSKCNFHISFILHFPVNLRRSHTKKYKREISHPVILGILRRSGTKKTKREISQEEINQFGNCSILISVSYSHISFIFSPFNIWFLHGRLQLFSYQFHIFISVCNSHVMTPSLPFMCGFTTTQPHVRLKQTISPCFMAELITPDEDKRPRRNCLRIDSMSLWTWTHLLPRQPQLSVEDKDKLDLSEID